MTPDSEKCEIQGGFPDQSIGLATRSFLFRGGAGEGRGAKGDGTSSSQSGASQPLNPSGFPPPADGEKSVQAGRTHLVQTYVLVLIAKQLYHP